ncbi:phospholipid-transporting ATPase IA-like [Zophobas morio]|uniref:phospholipid-transporting ATPase IA-like n=1 Tax=Zophobas morio TaxID=2755281 RepID=UPI00308355F5
MGDATNKQILFITLMLFLMALISFIFSETWIKKNWDKHYYLGFGRVNGGNFFLRFLSFIVLYHNMVPISLIVILEFVKYVQATWLIAKDLELYDAETDTPASVRTSSLNGELGQVQYIFTDKTGTLTRNVMVFRKCSIGGEMYGILPGEKVPEGVPTEYLDQEGALRSDIHDFVDPRLLNDLCSTAPNASVIRQFLTNLAVCHTVIPEVHRNDTGTIGYQAQSPDEGALVSGVKSLGFSFNVRTSKDVIINVLGHDEVYEILKVCEFTSARKRMSVIVRTPQNRILLMCKGADNVIFERLGPDQPYLEATANHLEYFASQGLRTLCIAVAELSEDEYAQWSEDFDSACRSLGDREQEVAQTCEKIEKEMFLLGCTAIEDKLQEEIPETLSALLSAGIKVWVLTGDKQETAINIGYASQLFNHQSDLLICNTRTREETHQWLINHINYARQMMRNRQRPNPESCLALVIDGVSLAYSMEGSLQYFFVTLALKCHSVVACRVSPLQKAHVVQLVRGATNAITLAIGDGANDVTMLQTAHVGVGISGKEGLQAARASDYSFAQFRFLKRLLLVHGNLSYRRIAHVVLYTFYKNICLYIIQFWFAMANGFSGQILFDEWMLAFYNVLFTALPPLCMGIFDRLSHVKLKLFIG